MSSEVWGKVYGDLWSHPKFITLDPRAGFLWLKALTYSKAMSTYGVIGRQLLPIFMATEDDARLLVDAGLWLETAEGWRFHDWEDYQTSRERDALVSQKRSEAGKKGGRPRRTVSSVTSDDKQTETNLLSKPEANGNQDESNAKAELELERELELEQDPPPSPHVGGALLVAPEQPRKRGGASVYPDAFEVLWGVWPKSGDTKRTAFTAWQKATRGTSKLRPRISEQELLDAVERFAADPNLPGPDEHRYIPSLSVWINQDRWENGPLPPRGGRQSNVSQSLDVVAQLRAERDQRQHLAPPAPPRQITNRRTA